MKKRLLLLALSAVLLLSMLGCIATPGDGAYTLTFYYRQSTPLPGGEDGIFGTETHEFGAAVPSFDEIFTEYFTTPQSQLLSSPFPKGLKVLKTALDGGALTVTLNESFAQLTGIAHSVAVACIAKTALQIDGIDTVSLAYNTPDATLKKTPPMTQTDFVSRDLGAFNAETGVRLYFSDSNGRYLVAEERKNVFTDTAEIPSYVIQQQIVGPSEAGLLGTMPEGTRLVALLMNDDGLCTVDFSSEFLFNKPTTELMERMCIYSVVNALTELPGITAVRFLVEGNPIGRYLFMDLSAPYHRDESAKNAVRRGLNEFDATLYVRSWSDSQLAAVPVSVRPMAGGTQMEDLLLALLNFQPRNGLRNPVPAGTSIVSMEAQNGVCLVDLSREFLQCAGEPAEELLALHAVAATLCSLEEITSVRISVQGKYEGMQHFDLMQPLIPGDKWFFAP